ncbi:hypothetical protein QT351_12795 [Escherichia coli]|nr:hypothetical protein [Escherichia coli]
MSAELMRLLSNIIRTGIISEVDEESWCVRVRSGELETGWLRWNTTRAASSMCGCRHHPANRW